MPNTFNNHLRQVILLGLIIMLGIMLMTELNIFLPGLLGGITLYILTRKWYFTLIYKKKWRKGLTALLFILASLVIIAIPVYLSVLLISPKITSLVNNQQEVIKGLEVFSAKIEASTGRDLFTAANADSIAKKISGYIPSFLNSTANILTNLIMMFFLLYYLLYSGKEIEKYLGHVIPLKSENVDKLARETDLMVRANALGIPVICFVQGVFAAIGYLIFGVKDWGMWGFVTGVFAFFPLVGTMIIWVPLVIYLYSVNENLTATGLMIYSLVVTGNVDYITRLGLLKKNRRCASGDNSVGCNCRIKIIWICRPRIWPLAHKLFYYTFENLPERVCDKKQSFLPMIETIKRALYKNSTRISLHSDYAIN